MQLVFMHLREENACVEAYGEHYLRKEMGGFVSRILCLCYCLLEGDMRTRSSL